jgi:hypothetical protein
MENHTFSQRKYHYEINNAMNVSSWRPVLQTVELSRWHRPQVSARTSQKLSFHWKRNVTIVVGVNRTYWLHDLQNPDITSRRTTASGAFKSKNGRPCVKQLVLAIKSDASRCAGLRVVRGLSKLHGPFHIRTDEDEMSRIKVNGVLAEMK